jgi:1-aminocyclopropane-1-carboxylate deaminase/D-cysteine desulfhydrase-like pyridoxal-dependent ACC family enzyme
MNFDITPIEQVIFDNKTFYIKRDDLLSDDFSGNKGRKFVFYLNNDFPQIDTVVSYGSNQSNAMYSLSVLAKLKNWKFNYYTNHISSFLEQNPVGNYKYALQNGMNLYLNQEIPKYFDDNVLFIPEGGRIEKSKFGIKALADEVRDFAKKHKLDIFLPSGTGTTALFLQKYLIDFDIKVYTTPCVGDSNYLLKQFSMLDLDTANYPTILTLPKKYHFGKLYKEHYELYQLLLKETNIEFDLLYDPIGWRTVLEHNLSNILYIHQGGLIGNESMLQRYRYLLIP